MKATARKFYVREINRQVSEIANARQELSRGKKEYGINWKFKECTREEFLKAVEENKKFTAIETLSGKFIEVDKHDIDINRYII